VGSAIAAVIVVTITLIAAGLAPAAVMGVVGAILAVPVAASIKIVVREVTEGRRARMIALRNGAVTPPAR
jgi:predicted PurR-regulated permease PerM